MAQSLYRGRDETAVIKYLIWQSRFDDEPHLSKRALAQQLGVSQAYICKVMRKTHPDGWDALIKNGRITFEELGQARRATARMRERAPSLFTRVLQPESHQPKPSNPYGLVPSFETNG
jgi:hypothetical protein